MADTASSPGLAATVLDSVAAPGTSARSLLTDLRKRALERARRSATGAQVPATAPTAVLPRPAPPAPLPPLPPDLAALGRVSAANDRAAHAALAAQADALETLRRRHDELAQKVDMLQQQADRMLTGLLDGLSGLETAAARSQSAATQARALAVRQGEELRSLALATQIDKVSAVVNGAQAAAYGQSGDPLAFNNLVLAGNQLFWSFLEPFLRSFGIVNGTAPSVVTWLAPLGTLLTGQLALSDRQHQRFLSGVATFGATNRVDVSLHDRVAPGFRDELERRTDLAVSLTPVGPTAGTLRGEVRDGVLRILRSGDGAVAGLPAGPGARVAWMVDLGDDVG